MQDAQLLNDLFTQSVNQTRIELGGKPLPSKQILSDSEVPAAEDPAQGTQAPPAPAAPPKVKPQPAPTFHGLEPRSSGYESFTAPVPSAPKPQPQRANPTNPAAVQHQKFFAPYPYEMEVSIPNYRPAPACANCAASAFDLEMHMPVCQRFNIPIASSYICDDYQAYGGGSVQFAQAQPTEQLSEPDVEEPPVIEPTDKELFNQATHKASQRAGLSSQDQEVYAIVLYKRAYQEKHKTLDGAFTSTEYTPDESYAQYKQKRKAKKKSAC